MTDLVPLLTTQEARTGPRAVFCLYAQRPGIPCALLEREYDHTGALPSRRSGLVPKQDLSPGPAFPRVYVRPDSHLPMGMEVDREQRQGRADRADNGFCAACKGFIGPNVASPYDTQVEHGPWLARALPQTFA